MMTKNIARLPLQLSLAKAVSIYAQRFCIFFLAVLVNFFMIVAAIGVVHLVTGVWLVLLTGSIVAGSILSLWVIWKKFLQLEQIHIIGTDIEGTIARENTSSAARMAQYSPPSQNPPPVQNLRPAQYPKLGDYSQSGQYPVPNQHLPLSVEQLFRDNRDDLVKYAQHKWNLSNEDAEDLAHDALTQAWHKREQLTNLSPDSYFGWVCRIMINKYSIQRKRGSTK